MNNLFRAHHGKPMTGASGRLLTWEVDCTALTNSDWKALAYMAVQMGLPAFGQVQPIPRGGCKLAVAMEQYRTPDSYVRLLVDDVLTTTHSMRHYFKPDGTPTMGLVAFNRLRIPHSLPFRVYSIWQYCSVR